MIDIPWTDDDSVWSLWQGDCVSVMQQLPDHFADAVITDPPYGTTEDGKSKLNGVRSGRWDEFGEAWDREMPLQWIPEACRVLKPGGAVVAFCDEKQTETLWREFERAGIRPLRQLYWVKTNPPTNPRKNFMSSVEVAVFGRKQGDRVIHWDGGGATRNVFVGPIVYAKDKLHPTQKPLALMRWLVGLLVPEGGVVFDPFAGAATTLVAAIELGRRAVGIELDDGYFNKGYRRLLATPRQRQLVF